MLVFLGNKDKNRKVNGHKESGIKLIGIKNVCQLFFCLASFHFVINFSGYLRSFLLQPLLSVSQFQLFLLLEGS